MGGRPEEGSRARTCRVGVLGRLVLRPLPPHIIGGRFEIRDARADKTSTAPPESCGGSAPR